MGDGGWCLQRCNRRRRSWARYEVFSDVKGKGGVENDVDSNPVRQLSQMKNAADGVDLGFGGGGKWENSELSVFRTSGGHINIGNAACDVETRQPLASRLAIESGQYGRPARVRGAGG